MRLNLYESLDLNFPSTAIVLTTNTAMHTSHLKELAEGHYQVSLDDQCKVWGSRPVHRFHHNILSQEH